LGLTGTTIADRDITLVETQFNASELAKTDSSLVSLGEFEKIALKAENPLSVITLIRELLKLLLMQKVN